MSLRRRNEPLMFKVHSHLQLHKAVARTLTLVPSLLSEFSKGVNVRGKHAVADGCDCSGTPYMQCSHGAALGSSSMPVPML